MCLVMTAIWTPSVRALHRGDPQARKRSLSSRPWQVDYLWTCLLPQLLQAHRLQAKLAKTPWPCSTPRRRHQHNDRSKTSSNKSQICLPVSTLGVHKHRLPVKTLVPRLLCPLGLAWGSHCPTLPLQSPRQHNRPQHHKQQSLRPKIHLRTWPTGR